MRMVPCADFLLDLEYQPIATEIITQTCCYKKAERYLLAYEKGLNTGTRYLSGLYIYTHI